MRLLLISILALFVHSGQVYADQNFIDYKQEDRELKLTGRIYHAGEGRVAVEAWPTPRRKSPKVDQIILKSPSGEMYRATENEYLPISKVPAKRNDYWSMLEDFWVETAYAACSVHGESCSSECGGGSGSGSESSDDARDGEAYAAFGMLAGIASQTEKEWVSTSQFAVKEEPGIWKAEVVVIDDKNFKHKFSIPFELYKIGTGVIVDVKPKAEASSITSTDGKGNTTTVVLNPDGSRVVTVTDKNGNIKSRRTFPPRGGASRTFIDPATGLRITETHNADGSVVRHAEDKDGNWSEGHYYPGGKPSPNPSTEAPPASTPEGSTHHPEQPEEPYKPYDWGGIEWKPTFGGLKYDDDYPGTTTGTTTGTGTTTETGTTYTPPVVHVTGGDIHSSPTPSPDPPRVGILLERSDNEWIPKNGDTTDVVAQLYQPQGSGPKSTWILSQQKRVITAKFVQRSNEPGQCVNKKLSHEDQETPDIYFKQDDNMRTECLDDGGSMGYHFGTSKTQTPVSRYVYFVRSEDYGSFSILEATCEDCVPLKRARDGKVYEATPEEAQVSVPKDGNDNQISDGWLWDKAKSPNATDDIDEIPKGNDVKGDGYTAYEEYRGFMVKDNHVRTSLDVKTLFIRNRHGLDTSKFTASKLEFYEINHDEWDDDKIVNYNYQHAHEVDQHGLLLVNQDLGDGLLGLMSPEWSGMPGLLVGSMGPPKNVFKVYVNVANHGDMQYKFVREDYQATVAHELGHAIGMPHHGNPIFSDWKKEVRKATGGASDWLPGKVVDYDSLCGRDLPATFRFGNKHNQGSGDLPCIMRYTYVASVYEQEDGSIDCAGAEPNQNMFCETTAGTGWNGGNRGAGNAANGNCMSYLQVNDV